LPASFGLPTGIAGIVTPSRISHHFGISNEYGISALPSAIFTSRVSRRPWAFFADSTLRSEPHSISLMAWHTASSVRKDGAIFASAPSTRASVWSSLWTQRPEKLAFARRSDSLYGASFLWMSSSSASKGWTDVIRTVPSGTVSRLIGCSPYHAHDSTPLASVSSSTMVTSVCLGSKRAMFCSSSSRESATIAKSFAGIPLRCGLSP